MFSSISDGMFTFGRHRGQHGFCVRLNDGGLSRYPQRDEGTDWVLVRPLTAALVPMGNCVKRRANIRLSNQEYISRQSSAILQRINPTFVRR